MALKWERFPNESFKYNWSSQSGTTTYAQDIFMPFIGAGI
jgi:hypothetical protein